MTRPTYGTPEVEALPTGTYLGLYHGRKDPKQHMDDWGFNGPVIGPLRYAHTTYASEIKLKLQGDKDNSVLIPIVDGCASFEGSFYGDWTVFQHTQRRTKNIPVSPAMERRKG